MTAYILYIYTHKIREMNNFSIEIYMRNLMTYLKMNIIIISSVSLKDRKVHTHIFCGSPTSIRELYSVLFYLLIILNIVKP